MKLVRHTFTVRSTIGTLYGGGVPLCFTLEDPDRLMLDLPKRAGHTAIPAGTYRLLMGRSPRFGWVPFILGVPGFVDLRIHAGNKPQDTDGCILVGLMVKMDGILPGMSRPALGRVKDWLGGALRETGETVALQIVRLPVDKETEALLREAWTEDEVVA